ncbi:DUF1015 domain-containing protein [Haliangium ochraceum]|uniref:DUF1015 domain-containing protein n=1 Tax=Haliangium ochraceum (strain DSM 14365 / JCM 11303 / SMP-2) TaxID=502025 RepID=D0LU46_HALO1|nr:DUF1015 domain-containing protein [Haliangium ochraceum]ACY17410.1 conserved hypothetical protein [Haliangium ochraceum DSM 14365]
MAAIAPFCGILYDPERAPASQVVAPPYDVIDSEERARLAARHANNSIHLILPQAAASDGAAASGAAGDKYAAARATQSEWLDSGVLRRDQRPAIYRYHQVFTSAELGGRTVTRRGFIAAVRLHAFDEGVIMPHERTLRGPKIDRLALMEATESHLSQIFGMYQDPSGGTDRVFNELERRKPAIDATTDDGTRHLLWRLTEREAIGQLTRLMAPLKIYIADGHHRYETMLAQRQRASERAGGQLPEHAAVQYATMFLANMNDPGLVVLPTHRLLHDVEGFSPEDLIAAASTYFDISTIPGAAHNAQRLRAELATASSKRPSFAAVWPFQEDATVFSLKPQAKSEFLPTHAALRELDVSILHGIILEELLGIDRAAQEAQTNIRYYKDTQKALDAIADCKGQICFIMNPTPVEQVKAVADAHEVMPQKSTYFYPKIASGLVFRSVSADEELD